MEASGLSPGEEAKIISATIPEQMSNRCLSFFFHAGGANGHRSHFEIQSEAGEVLWQMTEAHSHRTHCTVIYCKIYSNFRCFVCSIQCLLSLGSVDDYKYWITQEVPLPVGLKRFIVRSVRGGDNHDDDKGDLCFDDFEIELRDCSLGAHLLPPSCYQIIPNCSFRFFQRSIKSEASCFAAISRRICALTQRWEVGRSERRRLLSTLGRQSEPKTRVRMRLFTV